MTTKTSTIEPTATIHTTPPARHRVGWRWLRLVIPFVVLGLFWGATFVAKAIEEPDLTDPGTLSPGGTGRDGSSRLADLLETSGIQIERVTSTKDAIAAAARGDATIFAPTPDFLGSEFLIGALGLAGEHRVVIVKPGWRAFARQYELPVYEVGDRWATGVRAPKCDTTKLGSGSGPVGPASLRRAVYVPAPRIGWTAFNCYGGAVVGVQAPGAEIVVVGATEPFRNGRIGEETNQALATALLSEHDRLIWVDVHSNEPTEQPEINLKAPELPQYRRGEQNRTSTGNTTIDAFPATLWVLLVLGAVAFVLLAVAQARRLGGPVAEPLPVVVPAAEAVTGRGRLYQRIEARQATLETLRTAALRRIAKVLNPFGAPAPSSDQLVGQVAQRIGRPEHEVRAILLDPAPNTDEGLIGAVWDLDELVTAVLHDANEPTQEQGGPA